MNRGFTTTDENAGAMSDKLPACRGYPGARSGINDKLAACRTFSERNGQDELN